MNFPVCDCLGCREPVEVPGQVHLEIPTCWQRIAEIEPEPIQGWQAGFFFEGYRATKTYCQRHAQENRAEQEVRERVRSGELPWHAAAVAQIQAAEDHRIFEILDQVVKEHPMLVADKRALYEKWTQRTWPVDVEVGYDLGHEQHRQDQPPSPSRNP